MPVVEQPKAHKTTAFVRKKKLKTDFSHISQELYKRNMELAETNKTLSLLRKIDTVVLESRDTLQVLCKQITDAIALSTEFPFVALLVHLPHKKDLEVFGVSTTPALPTNTIDLLKDVSISTELEWFASPEETMSYSFDTLTPHDLAKYLHLPQDEAEEIHENLPLKSLYLIKLTARQNLVGVLAVGFTQSAQQMSAHDQELFDRLSDAVGVAVDNKLLFEENQRVVKQLQHTNEKLKALDEAKDEFISMASHQLRTPLTSVKGYMSMVLDGDAGKLSQKQQKLLEQAFTSSQRMVYLIADLLNVSRLKTGKFVIEPIATNLAEVVASEIEQLKETAKSRHLELIYNKPKAFPSLMLDETKTRQVVMNFVDNAIYYTPEGGKITVEVKNMASSVEFTVTDSGIGVPKEEQKHLFTKFYRAGNARKARPDGTGLGLFMAQKVVIAQGGAIIFKSTEGKGSTFGFTFAKNTKLQKTPTS